MKRRILMTGCSTGFGVTVRRKLMDRGHEVFGVGLGGPDLEIDFTLPMDSKSAAENIVNDHGPFDTLINNAGTMKLGLFEQYTDKDFSDSLRVNLWGPYTLMQELLKWWSTRTMTEPVRIINTASLAVKMPPTRCVGYVASKAALEAMTRALAREYAGHPNVIFCNIAPNAVEDTAMMRQGLHSLMKDRGMSTVEARNYMNPPISRMIRHDEMAEIFRFAVEDMPQAMTGTTLFVPAGTGA